METHVRRRVLVKIIGARSDFLKSAEEGDQWLVPEGYIGDPSVL